MRLRVRVIGLILLALFALGADRARLLGSARDLVDTARREVRRARRDYDRKVIGAEAQQISPADHHHFSPNSALKVEVFISPGWPPFRIASSLKFRASSDGVLYWGNATAGGAATPREN